MHLRAEYQVGPDLKFLANLDMMHLMERAFRRGQIPYALTDGFNPHIKLSMGTILPVGLWGQKEYFDLELRSNMEEKDFMVRMNQVLPLGMGIIQCVNIPAGSPSLMKIINTACYSYVIQRANPGLQDIIDNIWSQKYLPVKSRGKKKDVEKDLRPGLYKIELNSNKNYEVIEIWVSTGEPLNIRYDEILELFDRWGISRKSIIDIYRSGNYIKQDNDFYPPLQTISI